VYYRQRYSVLLNDGRKFSIKPVNLILDFDDEEEKCEVYGLKASKPPSSVLQSPPIQGEQMKEAAKAGETTSCCSSAKPGALSTAKPSAKRAPGALPPRPAPHIQQMYTDEQLEHVR